MPTVVAEGLTKSFGETKALRGVDLSIERGHVLGLLGPNGAGKTTAVRILTTLLKPDAGSAFIDGIDVVRDPRGTRARIGLTGQYAAVDERLTGYENLEHVGRLFHMGKSEARTRARELLDQLGLTDAADRVVRTYSGGMRRRLDIAMSLIVRPAVLFLDEPTTGLDPRSRLGMWELIEELARDGTTTLLTTQYLEEADRLAEEIIVIDHGSVIARGTSGDLKRDLGGERVEIELGDAADASRAVAELKDLACGTEVFDEETRRLCIPLYDVRGVVPTVVRRLDAAGIEVLDVGVREVTLDDVFLSLTGHSAEEQDDDEDTSAGQREPGEDPMTVETAPGTATDEVRYAPEDRVVPTGWPWLLRDSLTEMRRHLRAVPRDPEILVFSAIQPIMFVVLFVYVFGGSIETPGYTNYKQFVVPGIFAQTVLFGSAFTGVGIAQDLSKGFIDRLRSLPMYQSSMLIGRTFSDLARNLLTFAVMFIVGLAVGFRIEGSLLEAVWATLLLLFFSYAFSWIAAFIGLSVNSVEAANSAGFIWMFPLTFVSSAFVETSTLPDWLQPIADANPFTIVTNATRALYNGQDPGDYVWQSIAWAVGIIAVFATLSVRKYSQATSR